MGISGGAGRYLLVTDRQQFYTSLGLSAVKEVYTPEELYFLRLERFPPVTPRQHVDLARRIGQSQALQRWGNREVFPGPLARSRKLIEAFIRRNAMTVYHFAGTCRMGDDPATSVVDRDHRSHDVPNLFICDGSSFVTSGRGQPTMTIMALAFRASEHMIAAARNNEI